MSGSYVQSELSAEFGSIPPSFLPLANKRLFQHQVKLVPKNCKTYLSVPESYTVNNVDEQWLSSHNVTLLRTPDELTLGQGIIACLNLIEEQLNSPLYLLFGDTLFTSLPEGDNSLAVAQSYNNYQWSSVDNNRIDWSSTVDHSSKVICGYFKFNKPHNLVRNITQEKWDFIKGINRYKEEIGLSEVLVNDWFDFGHVNTYYHSKAAFTTQRSFNELAITPRFIEKSSSKNKKIQAEANWFENLPGMLKSYTPQYLGCLQTENGKFSYRLEYLHNTALNELFVFSEMPDVIWETILRHCLNFISECCSERAPINSVAQSIDELFGIKTTERLDSFRQSKRFSLSDKWVFNNDLTVSVSSMLDDCKKYLPKCNPISTLMHGDFCFSNILYDFRSNRIKTIDPRGITPSGNITIYGDINYDIAKISHSVLGLYDWIVAGYHDTIIDWENKSIKLSISGEQKHKVTQNIFIEMIARDFNLNAINLYAMQIQLFLSMLPLHDDDIHRQNALFANAFRLYQVMKGYE